MAGPGAAAVLASALLPGNGARQQKTGEATMWGSIVIIIGGWCHGWHGWW
jgi:hypothetical protein